MGLGDVAHQAQPQAAARDVPRLGLAAPVEGLEEVRQVFPADPRAAVRDGDLHLARSRLPRPHRKPALGAAVLHGVLDQVLHRPPQDGRVRQHGGQAGGDLGLHLDLPVLQEPAGVFQGSRHDLLHSHRPRMVGAPAGKDTGEIQGLSHHVGEAPALVGDKVAIAPHLRRLRHHAVRQVLARRADGRQGRVQLVGDAGHELDLLAGQTLSPLGGYHHEARGGGQQGQDAQAHPQVAPPHRGHSLLQGTLPVADEELPASSFSVQVAFRRRRPDTRERRAAGPRACPRVAPEPEGPHLGERTQEEHVQADVGRAESRRRNLRIGTEDRGTGILPVHHGQGVLLPLGGLEMALRQGRENLADHGSRIHPHDQVRGLRLLVPGPVPRPLLQQRQRNHQSWKLRHRRHGHGQAGERVAVVTAVPEEEMMPQLLQFRRPGTSLETPRLRMQAFQVEPTPHVEDVPHQAGIRRLGGPAGVLLGHPLPAPLRLIGKLRMKIEERPGDLAIEILGEAGAGVHQSRLHPLRLHLAHLADPPPLEDGESRQQDHQQGGDGERQMAGEAAEDHGPPSVPGDRRAAAKALQALQVAPPLAPPQPSWRGERRKGMPWGTADVLAGLRGEQGPIQHPADDITCKGIDA